MKFFDWFKTKLFDNKEVQDNWWKRGIEEGLVANPIERTDFSGYPHPHRETHPDKAFMMLELAGVKYHVYFEHYRLDGEHRYNEDPITGKVKYLGFFPSPKDHFSKAYRRAFPRAKTDCFLIPDDDKDPNIYIGSTRCSWADNFSRYKGRYWSILNAIEQMGLNPWLDKANDQLNSLGFSLTMSVHKGCSTRFSKILIITDPKELSKNITQLILPKVQGNVENKPKSEMSETPKV